MTQLVIRKIEHVKLQAFFTEVAILKYSTEYLFLKNSEKS